MAKWRWHLRCWLADKPALRELCAARERLFSLYRVRGHNRARKALTRFTDILALSPVPELKTLRTTRMRWLVIRRAYGYKSFRNYRLRLLSYCA